MAKIACKKRGQKRSNEASDLRKTQTEKIPSTTLKSDQKKAYFQNCKMAKTV